MKRKTALFCALWLATITSTAVAQTPPVRAPLDPAFTAVLPAPRGLSPVTADVSPRAFAALQVLHGPQVTMLAAFMLPANIDALNKHVPMTEFEYAVVVQPVDPRTRNVPLDGFDHEIALLKEKEAEKAEQMAQSANEYNATHANELKRGGVDVSTRVEIDGGTKVALDIPHAYGSVLTVRSKVNASSIPMTVGMAYLLIKGRMVMEGVYKSGTSTSTIEFVRNELARFALATLQANDEPTK